jgi:hypothetical protein
MHFQYGRGLRSHCLSVCGVSFDKTITMNVITRRVKEGLGSCYFFAVGWMTCFSCKSRNVSNRMMSHILIDSPSMNVKKQFLKTFTAFYGSLTVSHISAYKLRTTVADLNALTLRKDLQQYLSWSVSAIKMDGINS